MDKPGGASLLNDASNPAVPTDPAFYKELLDQMSDGVYFVDLDRRIQYWNEGAQRLTGYAAGELLGRCCQDDILHHVDPLGSELCKNGCPLTASIGDGQHHEASVYLRHKLGHRVPVLVRVQPLRDASGAIVGAIEIFSDNSSQAETERRAEAMKRLAFLDHLTQLPNRRFLEMSIASALSEFEVHHDPFGVLLFDIDSFKPINDRFGHSSGDRALQSVGQTLKGALRPTDTVGRWGGDEFLAIVRNVNPDLLKVLAERCVTLTKKISVSVEEGRTFGLSISAGAVLCHAGDTPKELILRADDLLYRSKWGDRGRAMVE